MLKRRDAIEMLLRDRKGLVVVTGLGSTTYDVASVEDHPRNHYLWGAMGSAAMIGLGLALARPKQRVLVVTGDGEMLMGLGSLATIGVKRPGNLTIAVFDNGRYGETGMQMSHSGAACDLAGVATACGIPSVWTVGTGADLHRFRDQLHGSNQTTFGRILIEADDPPRVLPSRDGVEIKLRLRRSLEEGS